MTTRKPPSPSPPSSPPPSPPKPPNVAQMRLRAETIKLLGLRASASSTPATRS